MNNRIVEYNQMKVFDKRAGIAYVGREDWINLGRHPEHFMKAVHEMNLSDVQELLSKFYEGVYNWVIYSSQFDMQRMKIMFLAEHPSFPPSPLAAEPAWIDRKDRTTIRGKVKAGSACVELSGDPSVTNVDLVDEEGDW